MTKQAAINIKIYRLNYVMFCIIVSNKMIRIGKTEINVYCAMTQSVYREIDIVK